MYGWTTLVAEPVKACPWLDPAAVVPVATPPVGLSVTICGNVAKSVTMAAAAAALDLSANMPDPSVVPSAMPCWCDPCPAAMTCV
jgi:hypothetical protein